MFLSFVCFLLGLENWLGLGWVVNDGGEDSGHGYIFPVREDSRTKRKSGTMQKMPRLTYT